MAENRDEYIIRPIGRVHREAEKVIVKIDEPFREGLRNLNEFSHVIVLFWASSFDNHESRKTVLVSPPFAPERTMGVFSTRSPRRPNPILLSPCKILQVDSLAGILEVQNLDAYDGTPVIDLKAYYPVSDRVRDAKIADWMKDWPEWLPEEGLGL